SFSINHFADIGCYISMNEFCLFDKLICGPITEIAVSRSQVLIDSGVLVFSLVADVNGYAFIAKENFYLCRGVQDFDLLTNESKGYAVIMFIDTEPHVTVFHNRHHQLSFKFIAISW